VRLPSVSYWPPWHGQPKPAGSVGIRFTVPVDVLTALACFSNRSPFDCTGQPRCAHRFDSTVKLGTLPSSPLLRMYVVWRLTSPCRGSSMNVAMMNLPFGKFDIGPRSMSG
jgi:hypothetical protein